MKKDKRGLPQTFSKQLLFDYRWVFIIVFIVIQGIVWHCSCVLGIFKCALGFGAAMLWAAIKGLIQNSLFNMDPRTFCRLHPLLIATFYHVML